MARTRKNPAAVALGRLGGLKGGKARARWHRKRSCKGGLCLSALHDAAFDAGLITLDAELKLLLSKRLRRYLPQPALEMSFVQFAGQPIRLPEKVAEPDAESLRFHREHIYEG